MLGNTVVYGHTKAVFINKDNLWEGTPQVINYFFMDGEEVQHRKVSESIDEWTWYANVVFRQVDDAAGSNVRIRFDPSDGSWSHIGRRNDKVASTDATMNLAWLDSKSPKLAQHEKAVVLHEFGHVLGLLHEHQSPAHGGYAIVNIQAALDLYRKGQGWPDDMIYQQVINVYNQSDVSNLSEVDTRSIMHYPQPAQLTGLPVDIDYNYELSELDKAYMMLQYPRREVHRKAAEMGWNYKKALAVIGAPPDITKQVLNLIETDRSEQTGEISPTQIRGIIEKWSRAAHMGPAPSPIGPAPDPIGPI
jgi:hypothetical protein